MSFQKIVDSGFAGRVDLTDADHDYVGRVAFEITGLTAAGAQCVPQIKFQQGSGTYYNKQYTSQPTEGVASAGTAITADGIYEALCDACVVSLNVTTAGSGAWRINVSSLAG